MTAQRVTVTVYAGASTPKPVTSSFIDAIDRLVVRQLHDGASTFQIVLNADLPKRLSKDIPILAGALAAPGNRVKIAVAFGRKKQCLMDGVAVHQELTYDAAAGVFVYSIIGEDLSAFMRLEEKSTEWPGRSSAQIAREIIQTYAARGLSATIVTPQSDYAPPQDEWLYRQSASDLDFLRALGRPFGHIFAIRPGASISANSVGYWGPPTREGKILPPLSVSMGAWTNVQSIDFNYDASASQGFKGDSRNDAETDTSLQVQSPNTFGLTSFAKTSSASSTLRRTIRYVEPSIVGALATAYAESLMQETTRSALRVRAKLDALTYGSVITPSSQIPVRGVGDSHDGLYYVEQVDHTIARGTYTQEVIMTREGLGSTIGQVQ